MLAFICKSYNFCLYAKHLCGCFNEGIKKWGGREEATGIISKSCWLKEVVGVSYNQKIYQRTVVFNLIQRFYNIYKMVRKRGLMKKEERGQWKEEDGDDGEEKRGRSEIWMGWVVFELQKSIIVAVPIRSIVWRKPSFGFIVLIQFVNIDTVKAMLRVKGFLFFFFFFCLH